MSDSDLDGLFDSQIGAETTAEDATATSEIEGTEEINDIVETEVEHVEEHAETEQVETEQVETETEQPDETDWKAKYEEAEELRRKNQSYSDSKHNELEKKFNEFIANGSQQQAAPKQEEAMSKEQLQDLMYEDPMKAFQYMQGQVQPQNSQADMEIQIQQGVQRSLHADYDDVIDNLKKVSAYHPELVEQIQTSNNKAQTAYEVGLKLQNLARMKEDPVAFEEQLRQKILKEMEEGNDETTTRPNLRKVPSSPRGNVSKTKTKDTLDGMFDSQFKRGTVSR
jgi:hypothetical protein